MLPSSLTRRSKFRRRCHRISLTVLVFIRFCRASLCGETYQRVAWAGAPTRIAGRHKKKIRLENGGGVLRVGENASFSAKSLSALWESRVPCLYKQWALLPNKTESPHEEK